MDVFGCKGGFTREFEITRKFPFVLASGGAIMNDGDDDPRLKFVY